MFLLFIRESDENRRSPFFVSYVEYNGIIIQWLEFHKGELMRKMKENL